jgi:hypothetical protein
MEDPKDQTELLKQIIRQLVARCEQLDLENEAFHAWLKSVKFGSVSIGDKLDESFRQYFDREVKTSDRFRVLVHHKWSAVTDVLEHLSDETSLKKLLQGLPPKKVQ